MKKGIFVILLFVIVLSFSLLVFFEIFPEESENDLLRSKSSDAEKYIYTEENKSYSEEMGDGTYEEQTLNGGGGGDFKSEPAENPSEESGEVPLCILVRPGNLPDITCSVDYIHKEEISLRLKNEIGEDLGIIIEVDNCLPEISENIKNGENKSFIFSCEPHEGYFNEQISISYIIGQTERVDINGFVQGTI
jgi:hypothetical protein